MNLRGCLGRLERLEGRGPCTECWEREQRLRCGASDTAEIRRILSIRDGEDSENVDRAPPSRTPELCSECGKQVKLPLWFIDAILSEREAWEAEQGNLGGGVLS